MRTFLCALLCCLWIVSTASAALKPTELTCEYLTNPLGLDVTAPRLSWKLESKDRGQTQTAYQVIVAASEEGVKAGKGDLWDSGKVTSDRTLHIVYAGKPLTSGTRCYWRVRVWDGKGRAAAWSAPAFWEMGLLQDSDWNAKWIARTTDTTPQPAPHLRRAFTVNRKVKQARIYICGLGYYELHLNGKKIGDHVLDPGYTRYDRRALYVTYDVTSNLKSGKNALGVLLGNGWLNVHQKNSWDFETAPWRAAPKLRLALKVTYDNGATETIGTDTQWKTATGPFAYDSIYGGTTYDARLEIPGWDTPDFDDSKWEAAREVEGPKGVLSAQKHTPIEVSKTITPVKVTEPRPGVFLFDMGQNFAGWAQITARGPAGTKITMRYAERLKSDGTLDQEGIASHVAPRDPDQRFQRDEYILKGSGVETWETPFSYHGFQYVEVTGFPGTPTLDSLRGKFLHSDIPEAGQFACSNPLLNKIWEAGRWSYLSNLQGIPTDCPHREKNGWTGDAHLAAEQGLFNFAPASVYTKWIQDLADEQQLDGSLPGIVPTGGWGYAWGNGPAWDSAFLLIPWYMYQYLGDTQILTAHYDQMKRYVDYLTSKAKESIVSIGLGDWVPHKTETPVEVTSTGYYYQDTRIVATAARLLGKTEEATKYDALAESIKAAFNAKFYNNETGLYANGSQTALACALYQGFVTPENRVIVLRNLVANIEKQNGHIDTGILGAKYVPNALLEHGRADVAYRLATQTDLPSWGHWIAQGATTLWEQWDGENSRNHIMFGDILAWFTKAIAGIVPDTPGFGKFSIKPHLLGELTFARMTYESVRGRIVSDWKLEKGALTLKVEIPANTTAMVSVPLSATPDVTESGKRIEQAEGVKLIEQQGDYAIYEVLSGSYQFVSKGFPQSNGK